ncbi:MAG: hypothetical protein TREMPRED_005648, partial [Tremellales sp. Tagirdzhanova-0007]
YGSSRWPEHTWDMTAFVARNTTPSIFFIDSQADSALTQWVVDLANEYCDIPAEISTLNLELLTDRLFVSGSSAGSDYMSWTRAGYPSAFAAEGDPAVGKFPGNFEHYVHTIGDRMDIDDETGVFSIE